MMQVLYRTKAFYEKASSYCIGHCMRGCVRCMCRRGSLDILTGELKKHYDWMLAWDYRI